MVIPTVPPDGSPARDEPIGRTRFHPSGGWGVVDEGVRTMGGLAGAGALTDPRPSAGTGAAPSPGMVWVAGGTFLMGSDNHYPEEAPAHQVTVDGFWIDRYTVTNRDFAAFVKATRHV